MTKLNTNKIVHMNVTAPIPYLRVGAPAARFKELRRFVVQNAGFDFLARVGDMMRTSDFKSDKVGVSYRSRHKCGDAFDYNQEDRRIVVCKEPIGLEMFFRTWLKCEKQDGSQGVKVRLPDFRGHKSEGWYFDFTAAAERFGWRRIKAWSGWQTSYNKMEFWHYQLTEGLTFDEAMDFLYNDVKRIADVRKPVTYRVIGLNDRGSAVRNIQEKLVKLGLLPRIEVDGVFGPKTQSAIKTLQEKYGLDPDGLVGPQTRVLLERLHSSMGDIL